MPKRAERADSPDDTSSDALYLAVVSVKAPGGPDKIVRFAADGSEAVMGMSGTLAGFYGAEPGQYSQRASTLDYLVGAVAACLLGTFRRALTARGISLDADALTAEAVGDVVVEGGVPVLKRILVSYRLAMPADAELGTIDRAHRVHHQGCAVSRSLSGAIEIATELAVVSC